MSAQLPLAFPIPTHVISRRAWVQPEPELTVVWSGTTPLSSSYVIERPSYKDCALHGRMGRKECGR